MPSKNTLKRDFAVQIEAATKRKANQLVSALREATPKDTGAAAAGWRTEGKTIVNDVEYISQLNEGHSKQAPAHFVESTVLQAGGVHPNGTIVRSNAR